MPLFPKWLVKTMVYVMLIAMFSSVILFTVDMFLQ